MTNGISIKSYSEDGKLSYPLPIDYLSDSKTPIPEGTNTGADSDIITPIISIKDDIFKDLPTEIKNNDKVQPFLKALSLEYTIHKNPEFTYLPLMVGENNEDSIILDWIYETISISFYFMRDRNLYSVTRYDPKKNAYSQTIEQMQQKQYKEVAEKVLVQII